MSNVYLLRLTYCRKSSTTEKNRHNQTFVVRHKSTGLNTKFDLHQLMKHEHFSKHVHNTILRYNRCTYCFILYTLYLNSLRWKSQHVTGM